MILMPNGLPSSVEGSQVVTTNLLLTVATPDAAQAVANVLLTQGYAVAAPQDAQDAEGRPCYLLSAFKVDAKDVTLNWAVPAQEPTQ